MFDGTFADGRLGFLDIDDRTCVQLREAWPLIERQLPSILAGFYDKMRAHPVTARILRNAPIDHLKAAQGEHWRALFTGRFDDTYMERVRRVGLAHERIGLEPRWYMGGYAYMTVRMLAALETECRRDTARFARLAGAIVKAVTLDMELAIDSYFRAVQDSAAGQLDQVAAGFERKVKTAVDVVAIAAGGLDETATGMAAAAERSRDEAEIVAAAAHQASDSAETVAAATEELAASISEISRQAGHAAAIASDGIACADRAGETVSSLADNARLVERVVRLIGQIARRSKMLALNASIEASRAGEAGKGFAVVASEVKALADQTAKAAGQIESEIAAIQAISGRAAGDLDSIARVITVMGGAVNAIAAAVTEQGAATAEISRSTHHAAQAAASVSRAMGSMRQTAIATGQSSVQMVGAARELSGQADLVAQEVAEFLAGIRRA